MTTMDIPQQRLLNQHLAAPTFTDPHDVVRWFGAVQAQDYLGSLWAIGLRMQQATDRIIERAIADRTIVRTWPMRGTLHFVAAEDIRWILALTAPRMLARMAGRFRQLELDDTVFDASRTLLTNSLQGGNQLTRDVIYKLLESNGISPAGQRGIHILGRLSLEGTICFAAREGKQFTFALFDEWVGESRRLERDEALAEMTKRYFTSHAPATIQDFVWWSGLTVKDARAGLELVGRSLVGEIIDGRAYWLSPDPIQPAGTSTMGYLLPYYDEYTVAYKDRSALLDPEFARLTTSGNGILYPTIVVDGRVVGTWRRTIKRDAVVINLQPFGGLTDAQMQTIGAAADRYGKFLGLNASIA